MSFKSSPQDLCHALAALTRAGPSGVDALSWRRLCTSFKSSQDLCHALAVLTRCLCTDLSILKASRLFWVVD